MNLLVLNCGSSTIKFELFELPALSSLESGTVERTSGHREAILGIGKRLPPFHAVAHRVVHGGQFLDSVRIDPGVLEQITAQSSLAPLHNPPAVEGMEVAATWGLPMVAVFDTSFHRTIPEFARRYALPGGKCRFGFHGISHQYVTEKYAELSGSSSPTIVTLHLGNGCSATAVKRGRSVETSMGETPLEGLVMGTRGGDIDPGIVLRLARECGIQKAETILNRQSGLQAIAGTNDMRTILSRSDEDAKLAVEIFCHRARKYVGAYLAVLEGAEAVVFTGGIGENAPDIRRRICAGFEWAGLRLDESRGEGRISTDDSRLHAWVIRTDEERLIAREAMRVLGGNP